MKIWGVSAPQIFYLYVSRIPNVRMKKPIDPASLSFLHDSIDPDIRAALTVSSSVKVPCQCDRCHAVYTITFFSVYRQWTRRGEYVCRACQAKVNGARVLAAGGLVTRRANSMKKYGVDHYMKLRQRQPPRSNLTSYLETHDHPMHTDAAREKMNQTNMTRWGVPWTTSLPQCKPVKSSRGENALRAFFESHTAPQAWPARWDAIPPQELDGYCVERLMAFEYCGIYWHSEAAGKLRKSHIDKHQRCQAAGIRLFTIFEDEWHTRRAQIEGYLTGQLGIFHTRLFARHTACRVISPQQAQAFITRYHIQPQYRAPRYAWGLFHDDVLMSVMAFQPHHRHTGHQQDIVLSRFVTQHGVQIVGGASKLLSYAKAAFVGHYHRIVSWSDNRWSTGHVYQRMGFVADAHLIEDYMYVKQTRRVNKQQCTRTKLGAANGQTEYARAQELGYSRIWDCGKIRWVFILPSS